MSCVKTEIETLVGWAEAQPIVALQTRTAVSRCLVVSASRRRRKMLMRAAVDGGWDAIVCADVENALAETRHSMFQLALIDMWPYGGRTPKGFRNLCGHLSSSGDLLLAVCGHKGDAGEEIWARQCGTWLYLPGVVSRDDVSLLCGEALGIAKQLSHAKDGRRQRQVQASV